MTNTDLLCELLINPFGHEQEARELLFKIDNHPPSDAEIERGLFCLQIALYFLACLTIMARIENPSLQKRSIDRLNDRARAFYAQSESQVAFSDFVVSSTERDRLIAALGPQSDEPDTTRGDASPARTTMLALFDLVVAHRLCEYVDAMAQSNGSC